MSGYDPIRYIIISNYIQTNPDTDHYHYIIISSFQSGDLSVYQVYNYILITSIS